MIVMQTGTPTVLETPRLILRVFGSDDVDALMSVHGDPEVMRFSVDGSKTREQVLRFIENARECHWRKGFSQWAIIWKPTGLCIGECGIWQQLVDGIAEHEISYRLDPTYWSRGIATEAATACRVHGFERLGLRRLISLIDPRNAASIRVAEKVGMVREKNGIFHGIAVAIYGIARAG